MSRLLAIKWTNRETRWNQLQWRVKLERSVVANSAAWWELYQQVKLGRFAIRSGGSRGTQIVPDLWPDIYTIHNFYGRRNRIINPPSLNTEWYMRIFSCHAYPANILHAYFNFNSVLIWLYDGEELLQFGNREPHSLQFRYKIKNQFDVIVNTCIAFNKIQK